MTKFLTGLLMALFLVTACDENTIDNGVDPDCVTECDVDTDDDTNAPVVTRSMSFNTTIGSAEWGINDPCNLTVSGPNGAQNVSTGESIELEVGQCYGVGIQGGPHRFEGMDFAIREPNRQLCITEDTPPVVGLPMDRELVDVRIVCDVYADDGSRRTDDFVTSMLSTYWDEEVLATSFVIDSDETFRFDGVSEIANVEIEGEVLSTSVTHSLGAFTFVGEDRFESLTRFECLIL